MYKNRRSRQQLIRSADKLYYPSYWYVSCDDKLYYPSRTGTYHVMSFIPSTGTKYYMHRRLRHARYSSSNTYGTWYLVQILGGFDLYVFNHYRTGKKQKRKQIKFILRSISYQVARSTPRSSRDDGLGAKGRRVFTRQSLFPSPVGSAAASGSARHTAHVRFFEYTLGAP